MSARILDCMIFSASTPVACQYCHGARNVALTLPRHGAVRAASLACGHVAVIDGDTLHFLRHILHWTNALNEVPTGELAMPTYARLCAMFDAADSGRIRIPTK